MDKFWIHLLQFATMIPMFPHPLDLLASANKIQRDKDLQEVAREVTGTIFPASKTLLDRRSVQLACSNDKLVIKRGFSDSSTSTFMPGGMSREAGILEAFERTKRAYLDVQFIPKPIWFAQPYIPALAQKGELRIFVVGLKVAYIVHTWNQRYSSNTRAECVDNITPLARLK